MKTKIVAVCGIDASGKTTSIMGLAKRLKNIGKNVYIYKLVDMNKPVIRRIICCYDGI